MDRQLHLFLAAHHVDAVVDARSVGEDDGRAVVGFRFLEGLERLVAVGTHGDGRDVDVAVAHHHQAQVLLAHAHAGVGELGDSADRGGLGGLTAGIGVDLGVHDQNVHVLAAGEDVVQATVADVVGPAVTTEDPDGLVDEVVGEFEDLVEAALGAVANVAGESCFEERLHGTLGGDGVGTLAVPQAHAGLDRGLQVGVEIAGKDLLDRVLEERAVAFHGQAEAHAVFGVVLEEAVAPGRAVAFAAGAVGDRRKGAAVDGRATGGVGDDHAFAEELGGQLDVGSLATARARTGELEQGLQELGTLDGGGLGTAENILRQGVEELGVLTFAQGALSVERADLERGLGAGFDADAATGAVFDVDLDLVLQIRVLLAAVVLGLEGLGGAGQLGGIDLLGADHGVGAGHDALVALDAVFGNPVGHAGRDAALLEAARAARDDAVEGHLADGHAVALEVHQGLDDVLGEVGGVIGDELGRHEASHTVEARGDRDRLDGGGGGVDGLPVHLDDVHALLGKGLLGGLLDQLEGLVLGQDLAEGEEGGLHDRVDTATETDLLGDLERVDAVEADLLGDDRLLHVAGQRPEDVGGGVLGVEQEDAAVGDAVEHVEATDVGGVVAGHEVGLVDQVGALDLLFAKAQVADGDAAGLLGVVDEVALREHVGVVADDLDGVLVGADGTVGTQTPEHAAGGAFRLGVDGLAEGDGKVGHVVVDTDGEAMPAIVLDVVEDGLDHGRGELLGGESVAATSDGDVLALESGADVDVEGLAEGTGLLGAVEDADLLHGRRDGIHERFEGEGTVEMDDDGADLLALGDEVVDGLFDGLAGTAHGNDDLLGIGGANVLEELVAAADLLADLVHPLLDDAGDGVVVLVDGLAALEVDVGILGADLDGMGLGAHGALAELLDITHVEQFAHGVVVDHLDLLDLVGGPETIEEVEEGHGGIEGGEMADQAEVHGLLDGTGGHQRETGLADAHHVGVVAEDGEGLDGQGAGGHVEDRGEHFARDLVHVRDHQEKALGGGEGGGQSASAQATMHGTGGTAFGLHFYHVQLTAEHVLLAHGGPGVGVFAHGRGGGDRVDRRNVTECVRYVRRCEVAVDRHHFASHEKLLSA